MPILQYFNLAEDVYYYLVLYTRLLHIFAVESDLGRSQQLVVFRTSGRGIDLARRDSNMLPAKIRHG